jgi:hypothetical protein
LPAPIDVTYDQIKRMLDVGGYENLPETQCYDLLLLIPCYVISMRDQVLGAFHVYKAAKASHQSAYAKSFLGTEGSIEVKKNACLDQSVIDADAMLTEAEGQYETIKHAPDDWLELQQALKRLADVKFRKGGVS